MTRDEMVALRKRIMTLLAERKKLGGFDTHAETIIEILDAMAKLTDHILSKTRA